jgi:hypothetical protein
MSWGFYASSGSAAALPPAFVAAGAGTATLTAIAKPASVVAGDTLLLVLASDSNTDTFTAPSGFTLVATTNNGSVGVAALYYRTVTGAEGSTFSASRSGFGAAMGLCVAYRNINPVARATSTNSGTASPISYSAIASAVAGDALISVGANIALGGATYATPSGHTERVDAQTAISPRTASIQVADLIPAVGAAAASTAAITGTPAWIALRAAFPPA